MDLLDEGSHMPLETSYLIDIQNGYPGTSINQEKAGLLIYLQFEEHEVTSQFRLQAARGPGAIRRARGTDDEYGKD